MSIKVLKSIKSLKDLNRYMRLLIRMYVHKNNGIETVKVINYVIKTMSKDIPSTMCKYLTRNRIAGNISALVTKFKVMSCNNSCLYIKGGFYGRRKIQQVFILL